MILSKPRKQTSILLLALLTLGLVGNAFVISTVRGSSNQVVHDTMSEFAPGAFNQTVLNGTESAPEIRLDTNTTTTQTWTFQDDDISGWTFTPGGNSVAEENPSGQIHVRAQYISAESYGVASRSDVAVPNKFVAEYRVLFDNLQPSGVADPLVTEPTAAGVRIDEVNPTAGLRVEVYSDRIVSFYSGGGTSYPVIAYIDVQTNTGQWYVLRFECDLGASNRLADVYRDNVSIGILKGDTRNSGTQTLRVMAYSRASGSGLSEAHFDYVKFGTKTTTSAPYDNGTYTSQSLQLNATGFGSLVWTENKQAWPYPWGQWAKYSGNPVLSPSGLAENILTIAGSPVPITYDGKYWLAHTSGTGIGLSYSTDPNLYAWTLYASNPILSPGSGETSLSSPCLVKDGTLYYLFFDVWQPSIWERGIYYATASAPTGPWTRGPLILTWGPSGSWDDSRVCSPFLFKDGTTYYLYYMGDKQPYGYKQETGVATTTEADFPLGPGGGNWTKYAGNPILPLNPDPASWDHWMAADGRVIKAGSKYFLYYSGSAVNGGSLGYKLGIAYADSPFGPWTRPSSPTLDVGPPGSWDSNMLVRGCMIYNNNNGKYYIVYNGNNGATWRVGIATADPYVDQDYIQFETRTSSDNSTWEDWKPVLNGSTIQSTPDKYFQYRATLYNNPLGSPVLTSVTINYDTISTVLYLDPSLVEKDPGDVDTTFNVNVTIRDVTDLYGFDFNLTWDDSLVTLVNVDFNTTLDRIWGNNNWFIGDNQTGPGYYKLAAVSIANSFTSAEANALATLTFLVKLSNFQQETPIHFTTHKLGDSHWSSIPHTTIDGTYRINGKKPTLKLTPSSVTCRKLGEVLTLTINVSDVIDLEDFKFEIHYNTTLLDCVSVVWPAWVTGTMNVDEANGNVTGYTSGSMKTGNFTLMLATFTASYYHLWKAIPDWQNNLTGTIYVQWANLSFSGMPDLRYEKGGSNQVNVDPTEVVYTFSPIQGDLDNNGSVDIFDLRTEAALYDTSNPDYNLTGDNIIDIYDLVIVAANFNYAYSP